MLNPDPNSNCSLLARYDRRNVFRHISREQTGVVELWFLGRGDRLVLLVAPEPLRMRLQCVAPIQVRAEPRDHPHIPLFGSCNKFAGKIAAIQKLGRTVKRDLRWVKRHNPGDRRKHDVALEAGKIISPFLYV